MATKHLMVVIFVNSGYNRNGIYRRQSSKNQAIKVHLLKFIHHDISRQFQVDEVRDVANYLGWIYILTESRRIHVMDQEKSKVTDILLQLSEETPTCLFVDNLALYCGYSNGQIEIRQRLPPCSLIKITSENDAGGPGSKQIVSLSSSDRYLLVNTKENGMLIYEKDDFEFYKWIMTGGYTTLLCYDINDDYLFVVDTDNQVHLLNFNISRLIPLGLIHDQYHDIVFDGELLYLATPKKIRVFDVKMRYSTIWDYTETQSEILSFASFNQKLLILLENEDLVEITKTPEFVAQVRKSNIPSKLFAKLKNNYACFFSNMLKIPCGIAWIGENSIWYSLVQFEGD